MAKALDFTYKLLKVIRSSVGILVLIVIFYILQYIYNMHFLCSCKPGLHANGVLYMGLPPLILAFVVNIVEPFQQRKICYQCNHLKHCGSCFCGYLLKLLFTWTGLAAVWIAAVLFDGDWYVCLKTNFNMNQTGIPCKQNLTFEEQLIMGEYMTDSLRYGLILISAFLFFWGTFEIRRVSCRTCKINPYYRVVFNDLLAEEVSNHLNDKLREIAIKKSEAICTPYLQVIENDEVENNGNDDRITAADAWTKISVPGFYFMKDE